MNKNDDSIEIIFAPSGVFSLFAYKFLLMTFIFSIFLLTANTSIFNITIILSSNAILYLSYLLTFRFGKKRLYIDRNEMTLTRKSFSLPFWECISIDRKDIIGLEIVPKTWQFFPRLSLVIWTEKRWSIKRQYDLFDIYFPITEREVEWLAQELSEWLDLPMVR